MNKQVSKDHYAFDKYFNVPRWNSYYYQLKEILMIDDLRSVAEIGGGVPVLRTMMQLFRPEVTHTSIDVAEDLSPDVLGSVTHIPLPSDSVDVAVAFQVLEHIPFEQFEQGLTELKRISRKRVIISLPYAGSLVQLFLKIPVFPKLQYMGKLPSMRTHVFDGQHYWELGKRGYDLKTVRNCIKKHFQIEKEYTVPENSYHRMYVLQK